MTERKINQIHKEDGTAAKKAKSTSDWFLRDQNTGWSHIPGVHGKPAAPFSDSLAGNTIDFFTTGAEYFARVAASISEAKKSIFITGWQVNYDVELTTGQTLFACLSAALKESPALKIYVMPWLSPKVGVDTGDFETMLAIFQLNAGQPEQRAFCLPAMQQSDMSGGMSIAFSHHQKLVVIDNEKAYVGGIDLAYGRRDDGRFMLSADGRTGNELYNACVPAVHDMNAVECSAYLTRLELLAACSDSWAATAGAWGVSTPKGALAWGIDKKNAITKGARDLWDNTDLVPEFIEECVNRMQDAMVDKEQAVIRTLANWGWESLPLDIRGKLERLRKTGSANAANAGSVLLAWLNNGKLDQIPPAMVAELVQMIETLTFNVIARQSALAAVRREPYGPLAQGGRILPKGAATIEPQTQPRMPWHDVHCIIGGPSVYDLSMNFVRRWNAVACRYDQLAQSATHKVVSAILDVIRLRPDPNFSPPRIAEACMPKRAAKQGSCRVQVLRSAPRQLLKDEEAAGFTIGRGETQNNCLYAMLRAIKGAVHFIYIENQFFQSWYGPEGETRGDLSGPVAALTKITTLPGYHKFAAMLEIDGVPLAEIPLKMRWAKVDDVQRDPEGQAFLADLLTALGNNTFIEVSQRLGKPQLAMQNQIAQALVARIEQALRDGLPFHIYMVLPVHPEGTLDTLNIMSQVHLTMQSLVFGHNSLVNGVRRAILAKRRCKGEGPESEARPADWKHAMAEVAKLPVSKLIKSVGDEWKEYLTLLNLRNWEMIGGQPVTEQIYVHSKLLIADDRVAILGSANINDRSQLGGRDSELAVVVTDEAARPVHLDGVNPSPVSDCVHDLRVKLWMKLFGMTGGNKPAHELRDVILKPAAPETWRKIQQVAFVNAQAYTRAFTFIPRNAPDPTVQQKDPTIVDPDTGDLLKLGASLWPTWHYNNYGNHDLGGKLTYRMPFDPALWQPPEPGKAELAHTYYALANAPVSAPQGVKGYIVELPTDWTLGENNAAGIHLSLLAQLMRLTPAQQNAYVQADKTGQRSFST